jgi:LuxR family transcriptional regulator, maltose regulon positive regulatory protein
MTELHEKALSDASRHIIERPRLTRLLDETSAQVILLVAPAGYGKTVLARQWMAGKRHAWLRATPRTADFGALGLALLDAAQAFTPDIGRRFRQWLHARRGGEDVALPARLLAQDLSKWPADAWLVIDDYHLLPAEVEALMRCLRELRTFRLLLTARESPAWSTSRDLLYGNIYELGAEGLAMSPAEAAEVLREQGPAAQEVIELAEGWPAVIGLASFATMSGQGPAGPTMAPTLHKYIAEELYSSIDGHHQAGLLQLSLLSAVTHDRAAALLGKQGRNVLEESLRVGFVTEQQRSAYSIHPLLREFLHQKLLVMDDPSRTNHLNGAIEFLIQEGSWEDAFALVRKFALRDHIEPLLSAALYDLLERGLISTISAFVKYGRQSLEKSSVLDLATAELMFRSGFHERSFLLAESAGRGLGPSTDLVSRAFCRAGHAAYFLDAIDAAVDSFTLARETARTVSDNRKALWGLFLAAVEREDDAAAALLADYEKLQGTDGDDLLRLQNGRLHLGMRFGSVVIGLHGAEAVAEVVSEARDPAVRAAFWHVYAGALRLAARYDEALDASDRAIEEIEAFDLSFARSYLATTRALVYMGLSSYDEASVELDLAAKLAARTGDAYIDMSARAGRCRLFLLLDQPEEAVSCTSGDVPAHTTPGVMGEFIACRAIALARCQASLDEALSLVAGISNVTKENEASALASCARALVLWNESPGDASTEIISGFEKHVAKLVLDPFVFAFRLDRRLPRLLHTVTLLRPAVRDLLPYISSPITGATTRLNSDEAVGGLTAREAEVLELIASGLTNAEIASTLFLTVATVKAHVRNILRKLGLRTRTEAAIYAVTLGQAPEAARPFEPTSQ